MFDLALKRRAIPLCVCIAAFSLFAAQKSPGNGHASATSTVARSAKASEPVQDTNLKMDTGEDALDTEISQEEINNPPSPPQSVSRISEQMPNKDDYAKGVKDGKRDAKGKPVWILAGLAGIGPCACFGIGGIGLAYTVPYSPPEDALLGKSSIYIVGYYKGYRSSSRLKNAGWAVLGLAMAIAIDIALHFPADLYIPIN